MRRAGKIFLTIATMALVTWLLLPKKISSDSPRNISAKDPQPPLTVSNAATPVSSQSPPPAPLLGETILRGYGSAASTPEKDLTLMSHLMDNFTLLVKSSAQLPMANNESWAAAFRGMNPAHERFLPDTNAALNAQGQLVDRWQTPLFIHPLGGHRFDIRSAGPDKQMWTADDIHRQADGTFLRGAALSAPSLFDASQAKRVR